MLRLKNLNLIESMAALSSLPAGKLLINTLNAYSYNVGRNDALFGEALSKGGALVPDGMSIVVACRWLKAKSQPTQRIAGWDVFSFEMKRLAASGGGKCLFVGSSEQVLKKITQRAAIEYPNIEVLTYSPPYRKEFLGAESQAIIDVINNANPDLLWIGMTAPKQEKWIYSHWNELNIHCHCGTIGAVFEFYAKTERRAPVWMQRCGMEWVFRLCGNPKRMWRRYVIGNAVFLKNILQDKFAKE